MMEIEDFDRCREPRARALIPFGVFLVFYLGISLWAGDFYRVPMPVAFLVASASALVLDHRSSLRSKVELFAHGMGNVDIMTMCLIFILAGAFAACPGHPFFQLFLHLGVGIESEKEHPCIRLFRENRLCPHTVCATFFFSDSGSIDNIHDLVEHIQLYAVFQ